MSLNEFSRTTWFRALTYVVLLAIAAWYVADFLLKETIEQGPASAANLGVVVGFMFFVLLSYLWLIVIVVQAPHIGELGKLIAHLVMSICFISMVVVFYADAYLTGEVLEIDNRGVEKLDAIYFSIITVTTVGFGDILPRPEHRLLVASEAIAGYLFFASFTGFIVSFVQNIPQSPRRFRVRSEPER